MSKAPLEILVPLDLHVVAIKIPVLRAFSKMKLPCAYSNAVLHLCANATVAFLATINGHALLLVSQDLCHRVPVPLYDILSINESRMTVKVEPMVTVGQITEFLIPQGQ